MDTTNENTKVMKQKAHSSESINGITSESPFVFSDLLTNGVLLHFFLKFLEQEYSEENLQFYLEAHQFSLLSQDVLLSKALNIYNTYIDSENAPRLVNLTEDCVFRIRCSLFPTFKQLSDNGQSTVRRRNFINKLPEDLVVSPSLFDEAKKGFDSPFLFFLFLFSLSFLFFLSLFSFSFFFFFSKLTQKRCNIFLRKILSQDS